MNKLYYIGFKMLVYKRRADSQTSVKIKVNNPDTSFLGYCNWSYSEEYHITVNEAVLMFENFHSINLPYYVRIFNEMPPIVLNNFIKRHNISENNINKIYKTLIAKSTIRIKTYSIV